MKHCTETICRWLALLPTRLPALLSVPLLALLPLVARSAGKQRACPEVRIEAERLASLNVPRSSHTVLMAGGEPFVVGGHTSGFLPTATAEYYRDGQWHLLNTVYAHDNGFAIAMKNGRVMIGGGYEQHLGIGQTFPVEFYDPQTHTFEGYGCLDVKRTMAEAVEMDSGHVVITGNWYHRDAFELYRGERLFSPVKAVEHPHALPYLFKTAPDNVLALSVRDNFNNLYDTIWIDPLKGEPYTLPFFREWRPTLKGDLHHSHDASFIGCEARRQFDYLMAVADRQGQVAIALVSNGTFALLPTTHPVPMSHGGRPLDWFTTAIADTLRHRAYLVGHCADHRIYVYGIDYGKQPAAATLYFTDPQDSIGFSAPIITPEGHLLMAGGQHESHFAPYASVVLLHVGSPDSGQPGDSFALAWLWGLMAVVVVVGGLWWWRRKRADSAPVAAVNTTETTDAIETAAPKETTEERAAAGDAFDSKAVALMARIETLMDHDRLFLQPELKVADVATLLGVGARQVSDCIKSQRDSSFTQLVNGYRIAHAQQLLREQPDAKMAAVALQSGFANETSFFRTFKLITGATPREWALQH